MSELEAHLQDMGADDGLYSPVASDADCAHEGARAHGHHRQDFHVSIYRSYKERWLMLAIFCSLTATNAVTWICFAPIQDASSKYFGVSNTLINVLSVLFMVLYMPGSVLATYVFSRFDTKRGLAMGIGLTAAGAWLRCVATISSISSDTSWRYGWVVAGQVLCGLGQPFFTNAPAKLATEWFGVKQRAVATTVGAMFNPIGIALGQVVPPALVSSDGSGMDILLLVMAVAASAFFLATVFLYQTRPPSPPSRSVHSKSLLKMESRASVGVFNDEFFQEIKVCCSDRNFLVLTLSFGIGLGTFNALTTLIEQIVRPCGYSSDDAGTFGALIIGCGLLGAAIAGPLLDATHKYNLFLRAGFACCGLVGVAFIFCLRPNQPYIVGASFGVLGFFMLPLLPISLECAVECTYPMNEEISGGILMFAGNISGIVMIFMMGALIDMRPTYTDVYTPASMVLVGVLASCVLASQFYRGPYKRLDSEQ